MVSALWPACPGCGQEVEGSGLQHPALRPWSAPDGRTWHQGCRPVPAEAVPDPEPDPEPEPIKPTFRRRLLAALRPRTLA
jgi:hypothetical protein